MKRIPTSPWNPEKTVLVGTYRKDPLEKRVLPKSIYGYPVHDWGKSRNVGCAARWLYEV